MIFEKYSDIPKLTELGFKVVKCPDPTWEYIRSYYDDNKVNQINEEFEGKDQFIKGSGSSTLITITDEFRNKVHNDLYDLHKEFCNHNIEKSYVYGIRSYKRGVVLETHKDRVETHHIASIICVDKDLRCGCSNKEFGDDWGLDIEDHNGKWHKIYLEVGEMIMYESAACQHGRLSPFEGTYFNNLFVHYKLV